MVTFASIKKASKIIGLSEPFIRKLVEEGKCPGYYTGTRFHVNVDALAEYLDKESRKEGIFPPRRKRKTKKSAEE